MVPLTLFGVDLTLFGVDFTLSGVDLTIFGVEFTLFGVDLTLFGVEFPLFGVDLTLFGVEFTLLGVTTPTSSVSQRLRDDNAMGVCSARVEADPHLKPSLQRDVWSWRRQIRTELSSEHETI